MNLILEDMVLKSSITNRFKCRMEKYWDNINWKLLDKIKSIKKKPSVWDLK